jgi:hypothetical protein
MKDVLPWMSAASGQAFRVFISDDRHRLVPVSNYRAQIAGALPNKEVEGKKEEGLQPPASLQIPPNTRPVGHLRTDVRTITS